MTASATGVAALSREARLLLLAARRGDAADDAMCALISGGEAPDWPLLHALAHRERAVPVLWRRLTSLPCARDAARGAAGLEEIALSYEFRMMYLRQRLEDTVAALAAAGIVVVLLKGAALAMTVYSSFTERPMVDLDLLVPRDRVEEAREVALTAGWEWRRDEQLDQFWAGHHHLEPLRDSRGMGVGLELHTGLFFEGNPFDFTPEMVWRDATPVALRGGRALVPSVLHRLLHLSLHLAWSHGFDHGVWRGVRDADAIVAGGGVDWDALAGLAIRSRAATSCYWTLRLTRTLLGTAVPERVLDALRPRLPNAALRAIERHYVSTAFAGEDLCPSVRVRELVWRAAIQPGRSGHGTVVPWVREKEFTPSSTGDFAWASALGSARSPAGALRHVRNLGAWRRYLRLLMG